MISRSTDISAALRSRQRGFLMNPYRFASQPESEPVLTDLWSACSIKKLFASYSGPCLKVRRSSDNATMNVGFSGGTLDTVSLLEWSGASSVFVERWYDQTASGNDFTQASFWWQPRVINAGVFDDCLWFDGVDDGMKTINSSGVVSAITTFYKGLIRSNTTGAIIEKSTDPNQQNGFYILSLNNSGNNVLRIGVMNPGTGGAGNFTVWNATDSPTTSDAVWAIRYDRSLSTANNREAWRRVWRNGTEQNVSFVVTANTGPTDTFFANNPYCIGSRGGGSTNVPAPLNLKTLLIYHSNKDLQINEIAELI